MTRYKFCTANQAGVINVINPSQDSLLNFRSEHGFAIANAVQLIRDVTGNNHK